MVEFKSPENPAYIARIVDSWISGEQFLKLYFVDILGRNPTVYQWKQSGLLENDKELQLINGLETYINDSPHLGVPHIGIAFPHVTTMFRWGDPQVGEQETNIFHEGAGDTPQLENITLSSSKPVGCPAELYILGREGVIRAQSGNMVTYLTTFIRDGRYRGSEVIEPNLVRKDLIDQEKIRGKIITKKMIP